MMRSNFSGLTTVDMKRMAFELAHPFSIQQGNTGWKWLHVIILRL